MVWLGVGVWGLGFKVWVVGFFRVRGMMGRGGPAKPRTVSGCSYQSTYLVYCSALRFASHPCVPDPKPKPCLPARRSNISPVTIHFRQSWACETKTNTQALLSLNHPKPSTSSSAWLPTQPSFSGFPEHLFLAAAIPLPSPCGVAESSIHCESAIRLFLLMSSSTGLSSGI